MSKIIIFVKSLTAVCFLALLGFFIRQQTSSQDFEMQGNRVPASNAIPASVQKIAKSTKMILKKIGPGENNRSFYRLEPDSTYRVKFTEKVKIDAVQKSQEHYATGDLVLNAVGKVDGGLAVMAQIKYSKLVSDQLDFSIGYELGTLAPVGQDPSSVTPVSNKLMFLLKPDGKVSGFFISKDQKQPSKAALLILSNTVSKIFLVSEFHDKGEWVQPLEIQKGAKMLFSMRAEPQKSGLLRISGNGSPEASVQSKVKEFQVHMERRNSVGMEWSPLAGVPVVLERNDLIEVGQGGAAVRIVQALSGEWKKEAGNPFTLEDASKFNLQLLPEELKLSMAEDPKNHARRLAAAREQTASRIRALIKKGSYTSGERRVLFDELSDHLKTHPEEVANYLSLIYEYPSGTAPRSILIGSLGYLGTPEAQRALVATYRTAAPNETEKNKILIELNLGTEPLTRATKDFLLSVYQNPKEQGVARTAGLALGSSLSREKDDALVAKLRSDYDSETNSFKRAYLIQVMGNDQTGHFQDVLVQAVHNPKDLQSRLTAYHALGASRDPNSDQVLFAATKTETNPEAQRALYLSIAQRPYGKEVRKFFSDCVRSGLDESLRQVCANAVIAHRTDAETLIFLRNQSNSEKNPALKRRFTEAVSSIDLAARGQK